MSSSRNTTHKNNTKPTNPNTSNPITFNPSKQTYADLLKQTNNQTTTKHKLNFSLAVDQNYNSNHSIFAELKSLDGASNTQHIILDEGFYDFTTKYIGGLHILIQFPDQESVDKALTNASLASHFKALIPWNITYRIPNRITWLSISGLPPQMWFSGPLTSIAKLWGDILIPKECNARQFNRSMGK
ncbi:hypothetical protein Tco_0187376, partial [Tanacetum coccineum]